jgi:hypothetical protein
MVYKYVMLSNIVLQYKHMKWGVRPMELRIPEYSGYSSLLFKYVSSNGH